MAVNDSIEISGEDQASYIFQYFILILFHKYDCKFIVLSTAYPLQAILLGYQLKMSLLPFANENKFQRMCREHLPIEV